MMLCVGLWLGEKWVLFVVGDRGLKSRQRTHRFGLIVMDVGEQRDWGGRRGLRFRWLFGEGVERWRRNRWLSRLCHFLDSRACGVGLRVGRGGVRSLRLLGLLCRFGILDGFRGAGRLFRGRCAIRLVFSRRRRRVRCHRLFRQILHRDSC